MGEEAVDILVIEDDPNHAEQTLRALAKSGIPAHVRVIDDSVAALDYLLGTPDGVQAAPRVILLDLNLPRVSGIEVLRRLLGRVESATALDQSGSGLPCTPGSYVGKCLPARASELAPPVSFE